jgi:hypothetical protein
MAKYPVEIGDDEGTAEAVNYLLSGPSGLGQNFAGFSSFTPAWLTGNFRVPYTVSSLANLYVAPITLSTSEQLDERTLKFTFASAEPTPPFANGNGITVAGVTDSWYDGDYVTIGVVECTTTYVIVRLSSYNSLHSPSTGGTIGLTTGSNPLSTDANARVTVTGGTDRIFISGQLDQVISYLVPSGSADLQVTVQINKYYGFNDLLPTNPDVKFNLRATVAQRVYTFPGLTGTGSTDLIDTVFATVIDQPDPNVSASTDPEFSWTGYFWYILEVTFNFTSGSGQVTSDEFGFRSLSAQVVKQ